MIGREVRNNFQKAASGNWKQAYVNTFHNPIKKIIVKRLEWVVSELQKQNKITKANLKFV